MKERIRPARNIGIYRNVPKSADHIPIRFSGGRSASDTFGSASQLHHRPRCYSTSSTVQYSTVKRRKVKTELHKECSLIFSAGSGNANPR